MKRMTGTAKRVMALLLALFLSFAMLPTPALAKMTEDAMGVESVAADASASQTDGATRQEEADMGEEPAVSSASEPTYAEPPSNKLAPESDGLAPEVVPDAELEPEATDSEVIGEGAQSLEVQAIVAQAKTVALGDGFTVAIKADGSLWVWGSESNTPVKVMTGVAAVSAGSSYYAALKFDGSLWTGGRWSYLAYEPTKVMDGVASVTMNDDVRLAAIKTDGSLWVGSASGGSLTKVLDGVVSVSLGYNHSAAIKTDGSLWTWGDNQYGRLGDGTTTNRNSPVQIMTGVRAVSLGRNHSAAIKADGSLWTWGYNGSGQLGDGTTTTRKSPVQVMTDVTAVSLGYNHSAAIKADGSLWTWGYNWYGQLGDGTTDQHYSPVRVMTGVASVSLGDGYSAAIKTDGSLWTWGENDSGQLGIGEGDYDGHPTPVGVLGNVVSISPGVYDNHFAALRPDGALWMWGSNSSGQLGIGSTDYDTHPLTKVMTHVAVSEPDPNRPFPDVPSDAWYVNVVRRATSLGLLSGYPDGIFGPDDKITRGQVAVVLWKMANQPSGTRDFPDVRSDAYFYAAVRWAGAVGIVNGYGNGNFGPNDHVTREQLAAMLANYARYATGRQLSGSAADYGSMSDAGSVSSWAASSVGWCCKYGILTGSGGQLRPQGNASRAEAAKMLVALHDLLG